MRDGECRWKRAVTAETATEITLMRAPREEPHDIFGCCLFRVLLIYYIMQYSSADSPSEPPPLAEPWGASQILSHDAQAHFASLMTRAAPKMSSKKKRGGTTCMASRTSRGPL